MRVKVLEFKLHDRKSQIYEFKFEKYKKILPGPMLLFSSWSDGSETEKLAGFKVDYGGFTDSGVIRAKLLKNYLKKPISLDNSLKYTAKLKAESIFKSIFKGSANSKGQASSYGSLGRNRGRSPASDLPERTVFLPKLSVTRTEFLFEPRVGYQLGSRDDNLTEDGSIQSSLSTPGFVFSARLGVSYFPYFVCGFYQYGLLQPGAAKITNQGITVSSAAIDQSVTTQDIGIQFGTSFIWTAAKKSFHSRAWGGFDFIGRQSVSATVSTISTTIDYPGMGYRIGLDLISTVTFGIEFHHRFFSSENSLGSVVRASSNTISLLLSVPLLPLGNVKMFSKKYPESDGLGLFP